MQEQDRNLDLFSEKLTTELKSILKPSINAEQSDIVIQENGRHIAQFVLLSEILNNFNSKGDSNGETRMSWI